MSHKLPPAPVGIVIKPIPGNMSNGLKTCFNLKLFIARILINYKITTFFSIIQILNRDEPHFLVINGLLSPRSDLEKVKRVEDPILC